MQEIWKDINGYEGMYQVSNLGNVKSLNFKNTGKEGLLKQTLENNGYLRVSLCKNKKVDYQNVHRLVAKTFIPNPKNYPIINHIDANRKNNNMNNLEWCTMQHNVREMYRLGNQRIVSGNKHCRSRAVDQYDKNGNFIKRWEYMTLITKELHIDYSNISKCCKGLKKMAYGYKWKYAS